MTKQELLNEAKQKFKVVQEPIDVDPNVPASALPAKCYDLPVFEVGKNGATRRKTPFYVVDEGTADEEAFWGQPEQDQTFKNEVESTIKAKEDDGTIIKGVIKEMDQNKQFAIVRAFLEENGVVVEKQYFIHDQGEIKPM